MRSKIILILVIVSLIIGCISDVKIPSIPKSEPCSQQPLTSSDGRIVGTISSGDCSKSQLSGISPEEQKLVGTWNYKSDIVSMKFIFNEDKSGTLTHSDFGKSIFKYKISDNKLVFYDTNGLAMDFFKMFDGKYRFSNNDLVIGNIVFEKSWW